MQTIDYNKFILNEIDNANILDEDLDELENMQNYLSNFEETSSELNKSSQIISDDEVGLITSLLKLKNSIDKVSNNSQKFNLISQRISSIKIDLEDISFEIDNSKTISVIFPVFTSRCAALFNFFLDF